jgi:hypothetical protein
MAAGLGFKDFVTGEVLTAADVDGYLMQGVWVFASAAARDSAVTSPQEGNFAYLKDTNVTTYYTGSAWANLDTTGMTNPMTTTGDTIYSSSGSTPARLGIGSTGQVLTVAGGIPSWATPADGLVFLNKTDFSATTSTSINNVFTTTYDNYKIYVVGQSTSATNPAFSLRLRASGTDSTADYQCQRIYAQNTTVGADKNALGTDEIYLGDGGNSSFPQSPIVMDINSPFKSTHTSLISNAYESTSTSPLLQIHGGAQTTTNSFDGFTFICSTASTGSIYTYGYAKA